METLVSKVRFEGRTSLFHYENPNDHIQAYHRNGSFYELRQLQFHRDIIPMQSTVIDVGANVGNHTIFYAMHTWAGLVYPFEPNIEARRLLLSSLSGNFDYRARVSTEYVEYAVGNKAERLKITATSENNLGGTSFGATSEDSQDIVDCIRLDDIDFDGHISFLKIDVEGMELQVLGGAINLIGRFRPAIALEISARHEPEFWKWLSDNDYQVVNVFFEYLHFKNYLLIPKNKKYL